MGKAYSGVCIAEDEPAKERYIFLNNNTTFLDLFIIIIINNVKELSAVYSCSARKMIEEWATKRGLGIGLNIHGRVRIRLRLINSKNSPSPSPSSVFLLGCFVIYYYIYFFNV